MARLKLLDGVQFPDGTTQDTAPFGAGLKYLYNTSTANSDPGSGNIKFDNATLASITVLRISETDALGNALASLIQSLDDNGTTIRATVFMAKENDPATFLAFNIASAITDNGTWDSCTISFIASVGTFSNGDAVRLSFCRTGATGSTGSAGIRDAWGYSYDNSSTAALGIGSGDFRANNADPSAATALFVSHGTINSMGDPSVIWDANLRKPRGNVLVWSTLGKWVFYRITAVASGGSYSTFTVESVDAQDAIVAGENVYFFFTFWETATGAQVDTGTDDVLVVTPKAISDSHNVPNTVPGTNGNVLTSNGIDWISSAPAGGSGDVVGPSSSVDSEIALFNSTTGKLIKRASTTGILKGTSGVLSAATAETDYVTPTGTGTLTNKRITDRTGTTTSSGTPTINTDNVDFYSITALAVAITSFTTNLSGTPTLNQKLHIAITGTASRALAWGASFESSGSALLPTSTIGTARLDILFVWTGSIWRCVAVV